MYQCTEIINVKYNFSNIISFMKSEISAILLIAIKYL